MIQCAKCHVTGGHLSGCSRSPSSVEEVLTPAGRSALLEIAERTGMTADEVIAAVSREAVRRRPFVVDNEND